MVLYLILRAGQLASYAHGDVAGCYGEAGLVDDAAVSDVQTVVSRRGLGIPRPAVIVVAAVIMAGAATVPADSVAAQAVQSGGAVYSEAAAAPAVRLGAIGVYHRLCDTVIGLGVFDQLVGPAVAVDDGVGFLPFFVIDCQAIAGISAQDFPAAQIKGQEYPASVVGSSDPVNTGIQLGGHFRRQVGSRCFSLCRQRHIVGAEIIQPGDFKGDGARRRHIVRACGALNGNAGMRLAIMSHIGAQRSDYLGAAHTVNSVEGIRIGGYQVFLTVRRIPVDHIDAAAVSTRRAVAGGAEGIGGGRLTRDICPFPVYQHLPLIVDALRIVARVSHLNGDSLLRIGIKGDLSIFIQPGEAQFGITYICLGAGNEHLSLDAVVGGIAANSLDLIIVIRIRA